MKKIIIPMLLIVLAGCGGTSSSSNQSIVSSNSSVSSTSEKTYEEIFEDGSVSWRNAPNEIAKAKKDDTSIFPPTAKLFFNFSGNYTTMMKYEINISNEKAIPTDAISIEYEYQNQSNVINGGYLAIDLKKVEVGETYIELSLQSQNVSSQKGTICKKIVVKEYGEIVVETWKEKLEVDTSRTKKEYPYTLSIVEDSNDNVYGANYKTSFTFDITEEIQTFEFDYAVNHHYFLSVSYTLEGKTYFYEINESVSGGSSETGYNQYRDGKLFFVDEGVTLKIDVSSSVQ